MEQEVALARGEMHADLLVEGGLYEIKSATRGSRP